MEPIQDNINHVLERFVYYHAEMNLGINQSVSAIREEIPDIVEPLIARSGIQGEIPGVPEGFQFGYRAEMFLLGVHNDMIRGISTGIVHVDGREIDAALCLVAFYNDQHNYFMQGNRLVIYGGEGGYLREANDVGLRVLDHQSLLSHGNTALMNSGIFGVQMRVIRCEEINGLDIYEYIGLYRAIGYRWVPSTNGYRVYEFLLEHQV